MKYSLKNEYKELLNEEVVSILRKDKNFKDELWDVEFDQEGNSITSASKKTNMPELLKTLLAIKPNYANVSDAKIVAHYLENERDARNIYRVDFKEFSDEDVLSHLNEHFKDLAKYAKDKIGKGELSFHLAFDTSNWDTSVEPDAIWGNKRVSIKSVEDEYNRGRGAAKTGESAETGEVKAKLYEGPGSLFKLLSISGLDSTKSGFISKINSLDNAETVIKVIDCIKELQKKIFSEHSNNFLLIWTGHIFVKCESPDKIGIQSVKNGRINFVYKEAFTSDPRQALGMSSEYISDEEFNQKFRDYYNFMRDDVSEDEFDAIFRFMNSAKKSRTTKHEDYKTVQKFYNAVLEKNPGEKARIKSIKNKYDVIDALDAEKKYIESEILKGRQRISPYSGSFVDILECAKSKLESLQQLNKPSVNSSYVPQGKALKEVYSYLFKKKLVNEGGLAGHMMHPYEALDMTPRQIIDRIKEYSTSQKIIEKVDGQNLFFTVEEDGTLMFARNKEDMTHDDLVAKFTGHGAEKPFVEGGNAIKRGVEQWLQSAGPAAEMEIREVFHPDGETKSFINFEIMHPDKPNQIVYDEKYIVFHSIVDYVDGRKTIHSTNKGQRLEKIIRLMDSGISSAGFTLASNRTVNLNELTSIQIEDYVERIKEVALSLGIPEDITLGEGIENIIKQEIDNLGIEMNREKLKMLYDFVLYGEDRQGNKIKSKDFTAAMLKSDVTGLRSLDLTSSNKALKKVQDIISPFKDVFVDLGVDLLKGVKSAYMSDETNQKNIELLRDKLQTAMNDLIDYMNEKPENYWEAEVHRLRPYLDKVIDKDITNIAATTVEGGVYDYQGDLIKVTGGFAPLNQILGAAYRDKKGIFPTFKEKFMQQESNRRSLKGVFNLIF